MVESDKVRIARSGNLPDGAVLELVIIGTSRIELRRDGKYVLATFKRSRMKSAAGAFRALTTVGGDPAS